MQRRVERELADSDVILLVLNGEQGVGPGDRFIASTLLAARSESTVICAVNKIDRLKRHELVAALAAAGELEVVDEVFPISARRGTGLSALRERLTELLPAGPLLFPADEHSDQASEIHLAELIREQILRRTREELPHAIEVEVASLERREDGMVEVRADVWAESESQKAILIGKGGSMVRAVGTAARRELERELGARVYLDLKVRVRARWRRDDALLDRLGID
jgi:GTP-binding protein Era